mmetsp:Transcript_133000/g.315212  ORF Transcript_133000/g.315212 Transcript_133000/m.315212 type:complete len:208 (-) Transcript_133000:328-951(-)
MAGEVEVTQDTILLPMACKIHQAGVQIEDKAALCDVDLFLVLELLRVVARGTPCILARRRHGRRTASLACRVSLLSRGPSVCGNQIWQIIVVGICRSTEQCCVVKSIIVGPLLSSIASCREPLVQMVPVGADRAASPPALRRGIPLCSRVLSLPIVKVVEKAVPFGPLRGCRSVGLHLSSNIHRRLRLTPAMCRAYSWNCRDSPVVC